MPTTPEATRTEKVTILYTDLRGFLDLGKNLPPAKLASMMNEYYCDVAEVVQLHGGIVDKFIGDSVMAIFRNERDAAQAALAAKKKVARRFPKTQMSVGVATGTAVTGVFGPTFHRTYTALGDVVTRAVLLERCSHYSRFNVVVDAATKKRLGRGIAAVPLKGVDHPGMKVSPIYELTA